MLRFVSNDDIAAYRLPATTQRSEGLSTVGLGQPAYLEAQVNNTVSADMSGDERRARLDRAFRRLLGEFRFGRISPETRQSEADAHVMAEPGREHLEALRREGANTGR